MNKEQFLLEAVGVFSSSFDLTVAAKRLITFVNKIFQVDTLVIMVLEPELKSKRYHVLATLEKAEWMEKLAALTDQETAMIQGLDMTETTLLQFTTDFVPLSIKKWFDHAEGYRSSIALPLTMENNCLGFLFFGSIGKDNYTQEHVDLLSPLRKPFALILGNALKYREILRLQEMMADDNHYLQEELHVLTGDTIVGQNGGLKYVMEMVAQVSPLQCPVLLYGETGTGKEVIANAIHYGSTRKNGPFIKVNCGAIPESLIDSELFGHEKGAFTSAVEQKRGRFERANGGTIFLDEIGELPLQAQVRLLRAIQQKEIERVGGTKTIPLDIRIIAATHRNLENMVQNSQFREDLFFRINVFPILIPPLRQRKMDIPQLVDHFIEKKMREMKLAPPMRLPSGVIEQLIDYEWKGNVRELENAVERAIIRRQDGFIRFDDFLKPTEPKALTTAQTNERILSFDELIRCHIENTLQKTHYKIGGSGGAAELLQLNSTTLRAKMKKLGIPFKKHLTEVQGTG